MKPTTSGKSARIQMAVKELAVDKGRRHIMKTSLASAAQIAEIVGALSVVIGLLFVGVEIRENTVAQQFSATQALVSEYNDAIESINDKEFVCIYIKASADFNSLSQSNKIRFSVQMQPIFRTFEQLHYSALHGTIDPNVHLGFDRQFASVMQLNGFRQYWAARRDWFGDRFQGYVDDTIAGSHIIEQANFEMEDCD